jgi:hypothetical protein
MDCATALLFVIDFATTCGLSTNQRGIIYIYNIHKHIGFWIIGNVPIILENDTVHVPHVYSVLLCICYNIKFIPL